MSGLTTEADIDMVSFHTTCREFIYIESQKKLYSVYLYEEIVSHFSFEIMGTFIRCSCHALSEEVQANRR